MLIRQYNIAGWGVTIHMQNSDDNHSIGILHSLCAFADENMDIPHLLTLHVCVELPTYDETAYKRIREFDTGNGTIVVDKHREDGYHYIVRSIEGVTCAEIMTNADFTDCYCTLSGSNIERQFGINNTLMLVYAFAASFHKTLLVHASVIKKGDKAYAFIAKSGTGKSTQVANWLRVIEGCEILNDDNPVIRLHDDGTVRIYGSPWSGKTPCYRNKSAILGAINLIKRDRQNTMVRMSPLEAFATLLPSCSAMKWDQSTYDRLIDTVTTIIERVPLFTLHCLPDEDSAIVCHNTLNDFR